MKPKFIFLSISLLAFSLAKASTDPDPNSGKNKINEVNGVILDAEHKPLKDVTITAYSVTKKEKIVQTDEAGSFSFDELKSGTYKFVFEKVGFKKVTKEKVVIKTDETFQMNIEMIENKDLELMPSPFHFSDF